MHGKFDRVLELHLTDACAASALHLVQVLKLPGVV
jgi:hypothetical protein